MRYAALGDELSYETALIQASQSLDIAGKLAAADRDSVKLMELAEQWVKLADFMVSLAEHQEKKELDEKPDNGFKTGFHGPDKEDDERD